MAKELKKIISKHLDATLAGIQGCVLVDYRGLDSAQTQDLRSSLRKGGVRMNVIHNRLAQRVFAQEGAPEAFQKLLKGPTAVLYGEDGAIAASKSIVQWRRKNAELAKIKGGLFQGRLLTAPDVERLAALPDRETLRARAAAVLLSPLSYLVTLTQSLLSHFAGAVKARREDLEKAGG